MRSLSRETQYHILEATLLVVAMFAGALLLMYLFDPARPLSLMFLCGMLFTICLVLSLRLWLDPDRIRASQSQAVLNLASETLSAMADGLDEVAAQRICDLLLPASSAIAVAITDTQVILGYAGSDKHLNPTDAPIRTVATHEALADGKLHVIRDVEDFGFPSMPHEIRAGIIAPLIVSDSPVGTLKFYYPRARRITETQLSIAAGFAELLGTQMAAGALEQQRKMATSMELKALQSQINPHFLFNTLNTIASFTRTDPMKARELLREFAAFYRSTLEDASDLIVLSREVAQTRRYLSFETARFGEDRLALVEDVPVELEDMLVPAFMIQPLTENSVKHAMPAQGRLTITVSARSEGDDLRVIIADDGTGMSEERLSHIMDGDSHTGLGIAVRNINQRIKGYYGPDSSMDITSEQGKGTTVELCLRGGCTVLPPDVDIRDIELPGA